ncbi:MAG TPA: NB-ARC domain-containing protein [Fimbriimonadaceae bacterium]|nr:NB-ARC domain-containing protein [Fimbriimonadaceae bacterium]
MSLQIRKIFGPLAACVSIRDLGSKTTESLLFGSVTQAVEHAIVALTDRNDKTAVVLVGEDERAAHTTPTLAGRATAFATSLDQPGLFLTLAAQDIVRDRLQNDVRFEDFGIHEGLDDSRAERLFAVLHPDLPEPELPQRKIVGNCPRLHKSFVGRHRQVDELQDLILHRRMVTITGFPGVGKTAMAIHVARSFDDEYEDGVWWFSVDDRSSVDELLRAIATTRGLLSLRGQVTIERVVEGLAEKRGVIILDGCELMREAIGQFCQAVLAKNNSLTLLLTSTKPIGLQDEFIYRLEPMTIPKAGETGEDALIASEALALFFERATQAGIRLALDDKSIRLAGSICERVDGFPIAIELIAASLRTSSLQKVANQLTQSRTSTGAQALTGSLHSLQNALEYSYRILDEEERQLLHRLAMFRGEWRIEIAAQIWGDGGTEEELHKLHQSLVESSWIGYDNDRDTYRMPHTIRSFSLAKASAQAQAMMAQYCMGMAEAATKVRTEMTGATALTAEETLSRHYPDFLFSLEASIERGELSRYAPILMESMVHFWFASNLLDDAERLSNAYLAMGVTGLQEARALIMLIIVRLRRRKLPEAVELSKRCLELGRREGNRRAEAMALINLGLATKDLGDFAEASVYYSEGITILRELGAAGQLCQSLCNAADPIIRSADDPASDRKSLLRQAQAYLDEAKELAPSAGPVALQALWIGYARLAMASLNSEEAETFVNRAIAICARHSLRHEAGEATEILAEINLAKGLGPTAAKLLGLSRQIRKESGKTRTEPEMERFGRLVSSLHEQVDPERAEKLMRYGEKLDLAEILAPTVFNV